MNKLSLLLFALVLLMGCGFLEETDSDSSQATTNNESNSPGDPDEDELSYSGPAPASGRGNVFGEIRWNGTGAAGLELLLCADFSSFSGCGGEEFTAKTDESGQYLFEDIPPGVYALSVRVFDSEDWLYISSGILSSADFEVEAGETLVIDPQNIFKLDLTQESPTNGEKLDSTDVTLNWRPYEAADYYKVSMYPDEGDAVFVDKRVNESTISVDLPPVNCGYRWRVEAFSSGRVKIAETAEQFDFTVEGQLGNCVLIIQEPADGAEIRGDGIILDWEENPQAVVYKILMWNDDDPDKTNVLDFEEVNESSYRFAESLPPARYVWSVDAYDENGDKIGGTEIFDFTVRP